MSHEEELDELKKTEPEVQTESEEEAIKEQPDTASEDVLEAVSELEADEEEEEESEPSDFLKDWRKKHQQFLESNQEEISVENVKQQKKKKRKSKLLPIDSAVVEEAKASEEIESAPKKSFPFDAAFRATPVFLLAILGIMLSVYFISPLSKNKNIVVTGNTAVTAEEILEYSLITDDDYVVTTLLNRKGHARNIKNSSKWIKSATIAYQFPNNFTIQVEEYVEIAYVVRDGEYYSVLSSGAISDTPTASESLSETYITINLTDSELVSELVLQLATVDSTILENIQTISLKPTKATADLLQLDMYDGNVVLVPLTEIEKKLPYYTGIASQLATPSTIDMEVGIYSYTN